MEAREVKEELENGVVSRDTDNEEIVFSNQEPHLSERKAYLRRSYKKRAIVRSVKMINLLVNLALFVGVCRLFYFGGNGLEVSLNEEAFVYLIYAILMYLLNRVYNTFKVGHLRVSELAYSSILADVIAGAIVYVLSAILLRSMLNVLPLLGLFVIQSGVSCLWAYAANRVYFSIHKPKRTVVVYRDKKDLTKLQELGRYSQRFDVQKYVENPRNSRMLIREIEGFDVVIVVGISATLRNGVAKYCVAHGVQGLIEPKVGDILVGGAEPLTMFSFPMLRVRRPEPKPEYLVLKRTFDIVVSLAALIVFSPVMLILALLIKLYDKGPVFYKQKRLTKDGRVFDIYKFRSMRVDAEKDGVARLSTGSRDDRITPVGRVIRACRMDELPQLFNILGGSMSIVGPRPERPEIAEQYEKELPSFRLRLGAKAGLTGYAQVYGRYNTQPYEKLQMDLMYINHMSIIEDLRLMMATVKILFIKDSTEGIKEGGYTAAPDQQDDNE